MAGGSCPIGGLSNVRKERGFERALGLSVRADRPPRHHRRETGAEGPQGETGPQGPAGPMVFERDVSAYAYLASAVATGAATSRCIGSAADGERDEYGRPVAPD